MKTIQIGELYFKPYISEEEISKRVKELGEVILKEYKNNPPILIAVLNGSYVFAADLSRSLNTPAEIYFMKVSSYDGLHSTGVITEELPLKIDVKDKIVKYNITLADTIKNGNVSRFPYLTLYVPSSLIDEKSNS